jgi:hypothetical protein
MAKSGDRHFRHTFAGQMDGMEFTLAGGDFRTPRPFWVTVVAAPRVDRIVLDCDYPNYTGLDSTDSDGEAVRDAVSVQGTQVSLPIGTDLVMQVHTNKPLKSVHVHTDSFVIDLSQNSAILTQTATDEQPSRSIPLPAELSAPFRSNLTAEGTSLAIPFILQSDTSQAAPSALGVPIRLPADSLMRIYLEDADDIVTVEPARLVVNGLVDQPPLVETELTGVSSAITRMATIPVKGLISDDYGVTTARFEYRTPSESLWQQRAFEQSPTQPEKRFRLEQAEAQPWEVFKVLPLDLKIGQKLSVSVFAEDGDDLNGPNSSRGETYNFRIVSSEELLSILYTKELNLRRRFEQIIQEVDQTGKNIVLHRVRVQQSQALQQESEIGEEAQKTIDATNTAVTVAAERALNQIRKNSQEVADITFGFAEILDELVNNGVHTRQMVDRIDGLIVRPLKGLSETGFPRVDQSLGLFKLANEMGHDPTPRMDDSIAAIDTLLRQMKAILSEMEDLVEYHEVLKDLKQIMDAQNELKGKTEQARKKNILNKLKGFDLD